MVGLIGRTAIVDITKLILINVDSGLTVLGRVTDCMAFPIDVPPRIICPDILNIVDWLWLIVVMLIQMLTGDRRRSIRSPLMCCIPF
jgi:hypothetical protein